MLLTKSVVSIQQRYLVMITTTGQIVWEKGKKETWDSFLSCD